MLAIYFKQTFALLKQNKLISIISILGTALAVMMVMVMILVQQVNKTDLAPEINRSRMLYLKNQSETSKDTIKTSQNSGTLNYANYKAYFSDMKTPELTAIVTLDFLNDVIISTQGSKDYFSAKTKHVSANYWKIMSFNFIDGKPFNQADDNAALKKVVITESKARQAFGSTQATGKTILIDGDAYVINGVVKDVSPIFTFCQGDIFIPYSVYLGNDAVDNKFCNLLILAKDNKDFDAIKQEVRNAEQKYNATNDKYNIDFFGPYDQIMQKENTWTNEGVNESMIRNRSFFMFVILLLIPALNLSSFSMSQIKKRVEEIGIRKAFGATRFSIVKQVLIENFITSLIGGLIGLILSNIIILYLRNWLLDIPDNGDIPAGALISISTFATVFFVCMILNILSAGIPAIKTARMNIIDSLNRK